MNIKDRFEACIIGGVIGDAWGSSYENEISVDDSSIYYLGKKPEKSRKWCITDDTQLTLATCEVLADGIFEPEKLLNKFVEYYRSNKLTGIGASTLKSILDKEAGFHWSQTGRSGEYAAGNGVAMRIAPFAFYSNIIRENIFEASQITHKNDEAFSGALAVYLSIKAIIDLKWNGENSLFDIIIPELPDTLVRDRLIELNNCYSTATISDVAKLGNNGYVVNSVPFSIFCATKILKLGIKNIFHQIIDSGGDTDTNASIAGQIAGTLIGVQQIPQELISKIELLEKDYNWINRVINKTKVSIN